MKKFICLIMALILVSGCSFADQIHVHFDAAANELTELEGDYFVDNPERLILMAVNPDSINDGFVVDYEDKNNILSFKPPDMFYGETTFEYYFIDKNLRDFNVIAHVDVDAIEVDFFNDRVINTAEKLIESDIQEEYKEIYKQIIDLIMQIRPLE